MKHDNADYDDIEFYAIASDADIEEIEIDIYVCLNCGHLQHFHENKETGEITDTCRKQGCNCQSYSPEICN